MSAHTPGPWRYLSDAKSIYGGGDYSAKAICRVYGARTNDAFQDANARLIAAAPELLSSAENFLKWFRVFVGESGFEEINCEELRALQGAIAKATEAP